MTSLEQNQVSSNNFLISVSLKRKLFSARITFGVLLTFICCIVLYHLFNASNEMNEQRMQKFEVIPTSKGSLIYVGDDAQVWTAKLDEFLARKKKKRL